MRIQHHVDADPDPAFHSDADPDPAFHLDAETDPAFYFDADPVTQYDKDRCGSYKATVSGGNYYSFTTLTVCMVTVGYMQRCGTGTGTF